MFVTLFVCKFSRPLMVTRLVISLNHENVLVGSALANEASNTTLVMLERLAYQAGVPLPAFRAYEVPFFSRKAFIPS